MSADTSAQGANPVEYNFQVKIESDKPVHRDIVTAKVQFALEALDLSVYMDSPRETPKKVEVIARK